MTPSERDCLDFIIDYRLKSNGISPTYREIAEALSYGSVSSVSRLINSLTEKGALERQKDRHWRTLVPVVDQANRHAARFIAAAARTVQRSARTQAVRQSDLKELVGAWQAWNPKVRRWRKQGTKKSPAALSHSLANKNKEVGHATVRG